MKWIWNLTDGRRDQENNMSSMTYIPGFPGLVLWYHYWINSVCWNPSQKLIVIWVVKKFTLSWNLEVYHCVHKTPSMDPTLRHLTLILLTWRIW